MKKVFSVKADETAIKEFNKLFAESGTSEKGAFFANLLNKPAPAPAAENQEQTADLLEQINTLTEENQALKNDFTILEKTVKTFDLFDTTKEFKTVFLAVKHAGKCKDMNDFCKQILKPYQDKGYYLPEKTDFENLENFIKNALEV